MPAFDIITDSTANLTQKLIKENSVIEIPFPYFTDGKEPSFCTLEEFDDVLADDPGRLGIGLELLRLVTAVRENDRRDLLRRARDVRSADTVVRLRDRDDARMRRQADLEDVVHTDQALRERLIDLHDDLIGIAHSRIRTAAGSGQVQALLAHRRTFYHSHVDFGTRPFNG